jgi:hypothetical protein
MLIFRKFAETAALIILMEMAAIDKNVFVGV